MHIISMNLVMMLTETMMTLISGSQSKDVTIRMNFSDVLVCRNNTMLMLAVVQKKSSIT